MKEHCIKYKYSGFFLQFEFHPNPRIKSIITTLWLEYLITPTKFLKKHAFKFANHRSFTTEKLEHGYIYMHSFKSPIKNATEKVFNLFDVYVMTIKIQTLQFLFYILHDKDNQVFFLSGYQHRNLIQTILYSYGIPSCRVLILVNYLYWSHLYRFI